MQELRELSLTSIEQLLVSNQMRRRKTPSRSGWDSMSWTRLWEWEALERLSVSYHRWHITRMYYMLIEKVDPDALSRHSLYHWAQGRHEDHQSSQDSEYGHDFPREKRDSIFEAAETSSHHQTVSACEGLCAGSPRAYIDACAYGRYEVITTPTDIIMVIEYAGGELFNYIVEKGKVRL
jgi:hypothetical protein